MTLLNRNELDAIANLLTIRHNPNHTVSKFRTLRAKDFTKPFDKVDTRQLERLISIEIKKIFTTYRPKNVVVPLSGGVDSTLIAQLVSELKPATCQLHTVSMGFGHSSDEIKEAEHIANWIGHNTFHPLIIQNVLRDLAQHIKIVKEPRWNTYYAYVVGYAKQQLKADVIITGDGGDELFGGYGFRYKKYLEQSQGSLVWNLKRALAFLEASFSRDYVLDQHEMFGTKVNFSWGKIVNQFIPFFKNNLSELNQFFLADYNSKLLHDYAPTNKSFYDYYSIRGFSPMLTNDVINFACKINPEEKYSIENNIGKLPLRAILVSKGLNKFMLPQKTGYGTNLIHLWKTNGYNMSDVLKGHTHLVQHGIIRREWIDKHLRPELLDARYINKFLQLIALEYYLRMKKHLLF